MIVARVPALIVTPDAQHGVSQYSSAVAMAVERLTGVSLRLSSAALRGDTVPARTHLHFTDRLWGSSPEDAAERIEAIAARSAVTVTFHDVPQASDGSVNFARRSECYRRVLAASQGAVFNSLHEVDVLRDFTDPTGRAHVIPLPVDRQYSPDAHPEPDGNVAVLGFYYPGKGHLEVLRAVARIADTTELRPGLSFLGRASAGHEADLDALASLADRLGVRLDVSGYLDDAELIERSRRASVGVAAHRHFSASGSINTWIAAGRRPLVIDGRYVREIAERRPGTVTVLDSTRDLAAGIVAALENPASTWVHDSAVTSPNVADVASAYIAWWEGVEW
jgi:glycosyltransferase involved in cell wall biosynthesis